MTGRVGDEGSDTVATVSPADRLPGVAVGVLLVEDDARIRQALGLALGDEGYLVTGMSSGEDALRWLDGGGRADVVLLDVMLPGMDGLEVCGLIRARRDVPIIMVTARNATAEVIAGLEAGADDYVTKPLDAGELAARIRALLRRSRGDDGEVFVVGDVTVVPAQVRAFRDGEPVHLTKTELRILVELVSADGRVVTREELLERVWEYGYFGDTRLLDVHIRRLRLKIEPDPGQPRYILTVRGVGYRIGA